MFTIKKEEIKETKELIQAAICDTGLHVFGVGPVYRLKMDIWVIGYAEFKNGEIVFTPRLDGTQDSNFKSFQAEMKRKYRKK